MTEKEFINKFFKDFKTVVSTFENSKVTRIEFHDNKDRGKTKLISEFSEDNLPYPVKDLIDGKYIRKYEIKSEYADEMFEISGIFTFVKNEEITLITTEYEAEINYELEGYDLYVLPGHDSITIVDLKAAKTMVNYIR